MEYAQRLANDVRRHLERLKESIEEDLGVLDERVYSLTLGEADSFLGNATGLLDKYREVMSPLNRGKPRTSTYSPQPTGGGGARRSPIEDAALEAMQQQGYLLDREFVASGGYNANAARRRLDILADKYGWTKERQEEGGWRYTAATSELPEASAEASPAPNRRRRSTVQPGEALNESESEGAVSGGETA